jgi:Berberine and berberine like
MPYPEIYPPEEEGFHPTAVSHTMFMDTVDEPVAKTILEYLQASDAPVRVTQLRVLGGAMARVPADATAFAHRGSRIMANVAAFYEGPADRPARQAWVDELAAALRQDDGGAYVGFLGEDGPARMQAAYPASTWERLAAVKRRYDPANLFRRNHNVPPAAEGR